MVRGRRRNLTQGAGSAKTAGLDGSKNAGHHMLLLHQRSSSGQNRPLNKTSQ